MDDLDEIRCQLAPYEQLGLNMGSNRCPLPDHKDRRRSFSVFMRTRGNLAGSIGWKCHSCDAEGSIVDLVMRIEGLSLNDALGVVRERWGSGGGGWQASARKEEPAPRRELIAPTRALGERDLPYPGLIGWFKQGVPQPPRPSIWCGPDRGELHMEDAASVHLVGGIYPGLGVRGWGVVRWEVREGDEWAKVVRQIHFDGEAWWSQNQTGEGLYVPLLHADLIEERCWRLIILVEGEKCADAVNDALADAEIERVLATTLIGGSSSVDVNHVAPLLGQPVLLMPDEDLPGWRLAHDLSARLGGARCFHVNLGQPGADIFDWLEAGCHIIDAIDEASSQPAPSMEDIARRFPHDKRARQLAPHLFTQPPPQQVLPEQPGVDEVGQAAGGEEVDLVARAGALDRQDVAGIEALLADVARSGCSTLEREAVLVAAKEATGMSIGALRRALAEVPGAVSDEEMRGAADLALHMAQTILSDHLPHLIYHARAWWVWTGVCWAVKDELWLARRVLNLSHVLAPGEERIMRVIDDCVRLLQIMCTRDEPPRAMTEPPPPILSCASGYLHLGESARLTPHDPDVFITSSVPCHFNRQAAAPLYEETLRTIFSFDRVDPEHPDRPPVAVDTDDLVRHWHEMAGYWMSPYKPLKVAFLLYGLGHNAKTKLARLISQLIGPSAAVWGDMASLMDKYGPAMLVGATAFFDDDMEPDIDWRSGLVKKLSQQGTIRVERKYRDAVQFHHTAALIMISNHMPRIKDSGYALMSRMQILDFQRTFAPDDPGTDVGLFDRIYAEEREGVFRLAIEGLERTLERGRFEEPEHVRWARRRWLMTSNPVAAFASGFIKADAHATIYARDVHDAYRQWHVEVERMSPGEVPSCAKLGEELANLNYAVTSASPRKGRWKIEGRSLEEIVSFLA